MPTSPRDILLRGSMYAMPRLKRGGRRGKIHPSKSVAQASGNSPLVWCVEDALGFRLRKSNSWYSSWHSPIFSSRNISAARSCTAPAMWRSLRSWSYRLHFSCPKRILYLQQVGIQQTKSFVILIQKTAVGTNRRQAVDREFSLAGPAGG